MTQRFLLFSSLMFVFLLSISSCVKVKNQYSCDSDIDFFVTSKLGDFDNYSWEELIIYSSDTLRGIYNSLSVEKQREVWLEKLDYLIDSESENQSEELYFKHIKNALLLDYFTGNEDIEGFVIDIQNVLVRDLGWDEQRVGVTFATLYSYKGLVMDDVNTGNSSGNGNVTLICDCNLNSISACPVKCKKLTCNKSYGGCGWFWIQNCDGLCYG